MKEKRSFQSALHSLRPCQSAAVRRADPMAFRASSTSWCSNAENRSFDHLYGLFPGAEGLAQGTAEQKTQLDHDGRPLAQLPPVYDGAKVNPRFPQNLPNGPFQSDAHL